MGLELPTTPNDVRAPRSHVEMALFGVYEIAKVLTTPLHLETGLASVLRLLSSFLDMSDGLIVLLDETGEPELVVGSDWQEGSTEHLFDRLPERAFGQIVATRMPLVV
ncbi:MAG TPA: nif-specific transcriptional activator NifA, partial [Rhodospirillaceae bacterium]|nr:nif-specific transcriptional activator NifA [Rhodospirillaceae bacterium]